MENRNLTVPTHSIQDSIFPIRSVQVLLDSDLAGMYEVETRILNQTVKRNIKRFTSEFMFQLTKMEYEKLQVEVLISQIVISKESRGEHRKMPFVFTEQGVSMLAGIPRSDIPFFPPGKIGSYKGNTVGANKHER